MSDIFGFPADLALAIGAATFAYALAVHAPLLFALAVAWRRRATMKRRILFVGTVMVFSYGFLLLLFFTVCLPVWAFLVFVVPTLKEQGYLANSLFLRLADFFDAWWWLLLPIAILLLGFFTARYFASRWNRVAEALHGQ